MSARREVILMADGATRPTNPGPSAYGFVILDSDHHRLYKEHGMLDRPATNNEAEYTALIHGLLAVYRRFPGSMVYVQMDSRLVIFQVTGAWKITADHLRHLHARVLTAASLIVSGHGQVTYEWVPRARNTLADYEAGQAFRIIPGGTR